MPPQVLEVSYKKPQDGEPWAIMEIESTEKIGCEGYLVGSDNKRKNHIHNKGISLHNFELEGRLRNNS